MLDIFSEQKKVNYQLEIEGMTAIAQSDIGIIPKTAGKIIHNAAMSGKITVKRIKELEAKSDHDTAALVESLSEKCTKNARPWIHYGLTSNDLVDTSNSMQMRDALKIIEPKVAKMALLLAKRAVQHGKIPAVGRTHGQHASIISFGLKFANWAAEMAKHVERIEEIKKRILICKTLGVVGTGSLMGVKSLEVQKRVVKRLNLFPADVTTQIVPRERYAEYVFELALIGATLEKIAITFENIPLWHERDLSNSANERFVLPTAAILVDEMLETMIKVISNLMVNEKRIVDNLHITKGQIFAEFVLEALIKKGVPRFIAYRDVQRVAFEAKDKDIQYIDAIKNDKAFSTKLTKKEIDSIFSPEKHLGASPLIISNVNKSVQTIVKKFI